MIVQSNYYGQGLQDCVTTPNHWMNIRFLYNCTVGAGQSAGSIAIKGQGNNAGNPGAQLYIKGASQFGKGGIDADTSYFAVNTDNCTKVNGGSWWTFSDMQLKQDVEAANLDLCYSNVKNIPLRYYRWRDDAPLVGDSLDKHLLGWIAQEVEPIFPKAVRHAPSSMNSNYLTLNNDMLYASMFGAVQKLMSLVEAQEQRIAALEANQASPSV